VLITLLGRPAATEKHIIIIIIIIIISSSSSSSPVQLTATLRVGRGIV